MSKNADIDIKDFRDRLTRLLKERGLTVRQAASMAGCPVSTLQNWKSGSLPTQFKALKRLAEGLGTSLSYLLTGEYEKGTSSPTVAEVFSDGGNVFDGYLEVKIKRLIPKKELGKGK